ncbi:PD-(D/E)XK nuclease family protein [Aeoliella sp. ICT_H6.2]|uniref:PD-(D/E)XK nuclease family protein n=1 Tax=Aeoliella straminimaris TaxID=2954799 RepID=A0A9X2JJE2_9BACT|nr:PD-(D/E)XK nuclease family protein [Aeoliella straminimaris]MCO6044894.1 PD-(D/E)XK nuclease family protein [Aeoliella straminimaris]
MTASQLSSSTITALVGPANSGKTARLAQRFAEFLQESRRDGGVPRALWLSPHRLAAESVRRRLVACGIDAALEPGVRTMGRFAESIVSLDIECPAVLPGTATRWMLEKALSQLASSGELTVMAQVAERPGLADAIEQMIGELKVRGITAQRFANWTRRRQLRDRELSTVYSRYQSLLDQSNSADRFDLTRLAVESLQRTKGLHRWNLIVVDGFASLAYYERQLVLEVARRADETWIALSTADSQGRTELTTTAVRTLEWLEAEWPQLETIEIEPQQPSRTASLAHLSENIFRMAAADDTTEFASDGVEVVAAADLYDEVVSIARRVKSLLVTGIAAADVVVATASLDAHRHRIEEVFTTFGIPVSIARPKLVGDEPAMRTLLGLLELVQEDWPFRRVVATLASRGLKALEGQPTDQRWRTARAAAEWLVRELQIAEGQTPLLRDVERLAAAAEEQPFDRNNAALLAAPCLALLSEATGSLPRLSSPLGWVAASQSLAEQLGLDLEPRDSAAWKQVREAAAWIERASQLTGGNRVTWSLDEWIAQLRQWMATVPSTTAVRDEGCVRVMGAAALRHLEVPHLFVMGLDEGSFSTASGSGGLYSEQEYETLAAADSRGDAIEAIPKYERTMQLFYDVVRAARRSLVFSFAALDGSGQSAPPSPMLTEACRPFGPSMLAKLEATPTISAIPPEDQLPTSMRDWRLLGVHQAAHKNPALLGGFLRSPLAEPAGAALAAALVTAHHRARGDSFGVMEGVLAGTAVRRWFAKRFDDDHQWSTSQLENYAMCPYKFLLGNVLKIAPLGDAALEIDYGRRGSLLHRVFGELHQRLDELAHDRLPSQHDELEFASVLEEAIDAAKQELASYGIEGVLDELLAAEVAKWSKKYHDQHRKYDNTTVQLDAPFRPAHFELRFGKASRHADDDESPDSTDKPYLLELGDGTAIKLGGRIDRVDTGELGDHLVFQVIDYKSAYKFTMHDEEVRDGRKLQPPLYALAAAEILSTAERPALPLRVGYWVLRAAGFTDKTTRELYHIAAGEVQPTAEWQDLEPVLRARVRDIVEGVRRGEFPMYSPDEDCTSHCDFSHVCRVHQTRSLNKVWPPPEEENDSAPSEGAAK